MSVIAKKNVRTGDDALADVNPSDIYGNNSNIAVQVNDLAFVITDDDLTSAGYIYKAVASGSDDGTRTVAMSSGSIVWKRMLYADKQYDELPADKYYESTDGVVPDGYESFVSLLRAEQVTPGTGVLNLGYRTFVLRNGDWLWILSGATVFNSTRYNISTDTAESIPNVGSVTSTCAFILDDKIYLFTGGNDLRVYDTTSGSSGSWTNYMDSLPLRYTEAGAVANGKGYIFGASNAENTVYNKVYRVDSPTNIVQCTPSPDEFVVYNNSTITAVTVGNVIYLIEIDNFAYVKVYKYDTSTDSWNNNVAATLEGELFEDIVGGSYPGRHAWYDSSRNSIYYMGICFNDNYAACGQFDLSTQTWEYGWHIVVRDPAADYGGSYYDSSTDILWIGWGGLNSASNRTITKVDFSKPTQHCKKL